MVQRGTIAQLAGFIPPPTPHARICHQGARVIPAHGDPGDAGVQTKHLDGFAEAGRSAIRIHPELTEVVRTPAQN
jgi:hypothetical protein